MNRLSRCFGRLASVGAGAAALALAAASQGAGAQEEVSGKQLALDRVKGNCLACHEMPGVPEATLPGNIGPALVGIAQRYDRDRLRAQIWDAARGNPRTAMPPFGRNGILTEQEIDRVTDFILTL